MYKYALYCALISLFFVPFAYAQDPTQNLPPPPEPPVLDEVQIPASNGQVTLGRDMVTVNVTVMDYQQRFVSGLEKQHFEIYDDGVKQTIEFFNEEDAPVTVGILYDTSGSMELKIERAIQALTEFVNSSHKEDEYFLVGCNDQAALLRDFCYDGKTLTESLTLAVANGRTALYDAVALAVEKAQHGHHSKRAIIIISDGQDNHSLYTYSEIKEMLKEADVVVYAIGILDYEHDQVMTSQGIPLVQQGISILEQVTKVTGGRAFFPNSPDEFVDICTQIALELRHQYGMGYYPSNNIRDGRWHKIKVKVHPPAGLPKMLVRAKEGYYGLPGPKSKEKKKK